MQQGPVTSRAFRVPAPQFDAVVVASIILAGALVGLETYDGYDDSAKSWVRGLNALVLLVFIAEVQVKIAACGMAPWRCVPPRERPRVRRASCLVSWRAPACAVRCVKGGDHDVLGVPRYFVGRAWQWNVFDFLIVVLSLPFLERALFDSNGSIKILRLVRLARLGKLLNKV